MKATLLVILLTLASGCRLLPGGGTPLAVDGEWLLQSGTNQGQAIPIAPGSRVTLKIDGDQVGGSSACNIYGGTIALDGSRVTISALSMTEMACQEDRMATEAAYLAALPRVTGAERSGDVLVLSGPQVELRYALVPPVADADLVGTRWILESLISADVASSTVTEATLRFADDGKVSLSTGCRDLTGSYTVSGAEVQVTLDPYDLYACTGPLGDQDSHVLEVIATRFDFVIDGETLTLTAGDRGLAFRVAAE
jgi:heat shock protein HslJ